MKPLIMMLGLAGLGGFSYASWNSLHEGVASELTSRAQAALDASELDGVAVSFDHMDGLVKGATTEEQRQKAKEVILASLPVEGRLTFEGADGATSNSESAMETTTVSPVETNTEIASSPDTLTSSSLVAQVPDAELDAPAVDSSEDQDLVPTVSPLGQVEVEAGSTDKPAASDPSLAPNAVEPVAIEPAEEAVADTKPSLDVEPNKQTIARVDSHLAESTEAEANRTAAVQAEADRLAAEAEARRVASGKTKPVVAKKKPRLGIYIEADVDNTLVRYVDPNSAADKAGIRIGDELSRFEGQSLTNFDDLQTAVNKFGAGDEVEIWYRRDGSLQRTKATLLELIEKPKTQPVEAPAEE